MYVNEKMRPADSIPGMGEKGNGGMVEGVKLTIIYCKNFCNYHNVLPCKTTIKNRDKRKKITWID
jgi:hypothetical protein